MLNVALDEVTNQVSVVDLGQLEIFQSGLGEVAESVLGTLIGRAIGFQQREPFDVLGAALRLHGDFQLAEFLLVLHIGDLEDMSPFGNEGKTLGESDFSHCLFLLNFRIQRGR